MSKKSRLLALVLVLVMMLGVIPVTAFAQNDAQAVAEENTLDKTVLEQLADKATGNPFEMTATSNYKSQFTANDVTVNEGAFAAGGFKGTGTAGFNFGHEYGVTSDEMGISYVDKPNTIAQDINISYSAYNQDLPKSTKYIVYQTNVMRGESSINGRGVLRLRMRLSNNTGYEYPIFVYDGEYLNANGAKAYFSTSTWTNLAIVYDIENDTIYAYANGVLMTTIKDAFKTRYKVSTLDFTKFIDVSIYAAKNMNFSGRFVSIREVRGYFLSSDALINDIITPATTLANGVFNIDGEYYLFENNFPVTGATRTIDGYTITTEAKTGKIVKCVKADATLYKAWTSAQFAAKGVTLTTNSYSTNLTGNAYEYYGYKYTTTTENGTTYYILDTEKTLVRRPHYAGANTGDGYEFTYMDAQNNKKYYDTIPADATEIKDASGKVIGYKTATAPAKDQNEGADLSYYTGLENSQSFGTGTKTVNFAIKAGEGIVVGANLVRFRYYKDDTLKKANGSAATYNLENVKAQKINGNLHLMIQDQDCGIFRADMYTYISYVFSTVASETEGKYDLIYDVYVNGVRVIENFSVDKGIKNYMLCAIGVWQGATFSKPHITWGTAQAYTGAKVDVNTNPYTGTVAGANGVYTYTNGLCTGFTKNATVDGTVALKSYSMTAGDTLGVNFYVNKSNATKAIITVDGEKQTVDLTKLSPEADGTYKVSAKISSINLADKITLAFYNGNELLDIVTSTGDVTNNYITSAKDYANAIIIRRYYYGEDIYNAAKAMLNYAAYAERYFAGVTASTTANSVDDRLSVTAVNVADIKGTVSAGAGASEILGNVNLILNNATKIRVQLKGAATFSSEFENITYVEKDGKYYVDIDGITATNLDKVYSFTVNGIEVNVSVLGVAAVVANNEASYGKNFVNLMKALYLYSVACEKLA